MRTAVLGVRRSIIRERLRVELLLFHIVRSQLRWLSLWGIMFGACTTGKRPRGRTRVPWTDISLLPREHFGVSPNKLDEVAGREGGMLPLRLSPRQTEAIRWIDSLIGLYI